MLERLKEGLSKRTPEVFLPTEENNIIVERINELKPFLFKDPNSTGTVRTSVRDFVHSSGFEYGYEWGPDRDSWHHLKLSCRGNETKVRIKTEDHYFPAETIAIIVVDNRIVNLNYKAAKSSTKPRINKDGHEAYDAVTSHLSRVLYSFKDEKVRMGY